MQNAWERSAAPKVLVGKSERKRNQQEDLDISGRKGTG
jgi:hypothetical protein